MKHTALLLMKSMIGLTSSLSPGLGGQLGFRLFTTPIGAKREPTNPAVIAKTDATMARAERARIASGEHEIAVYRWTPADSSSGKRVFLVHGWQSRALYMVGFVTPLLEAGFEVVAFDLPAHGNSSGGRLFYTQAVAAIQAVVSRYGPAYALLGHSFGGAMVSVAASEGIPVEKLVLVSAVDGLPGVTSRFAKTIGLSERALRNFERRLSALSDVEVPELYTSGRLARLGKPTLVIHDREDRDVPFGDAEANAAAGDHIALHTTNGLGHRRILFSEEVTTRVARFLAGAPEK